MRRLAALLIALFGAACAHSPTMSIDDVLSARSAEIIKTPGVVGVFHGLMEDGKTEGIVIMVENRDAAAQIPKKIEGHPVRVEVSGKIRPLQ